MKVIGFNGSARKKGNTAGSLNTVFAELEKAGIETEMIHVGKEKVRGCIACYGCVKNQDEACTLKDDPVNEWIQKMKEADGILLGSPVYFSGVAGTMKSFLDRAFFVSSVNGGLFRQKVGAAVAAVRRSGEFPRLTRSITISPTLRWSCPLQTTGMWPMGLIRVKWIRTVKASRS